MWALWESSSGSKVLFSLSLCSCWGIGGAELLWRDAPSPGSEWICVCLPQATSPHQSQQSTVDVGQLHDPQTYTQHAIQVQHIQVTEPAAAAPASQVHGA